MQSNFRVPSWLTKLYKMTDWRAAIHYLSSAVGSASSFGIGTRTAAYPQKYRYQLWRTLAL